ncbi:hypothetical protein ABZ916_37115 [Streptomyces sp. NPDC046853]|uniref:hypothetical protein n=1 Tax=Streptomyces sp. NPDC046853 TaxID=3154920 RepID=UPI0033CC8913
MLKLLTLYASVLLERLARQLKHDEVTWCEGLAQGFCESWELRSFIETVRNVLLPRTDVSGFTAQRSASLKKRINGRYEEAVTALNEWTVQERDKEKARNDPDPYALKEADLKCRNARGRAERHCCFLLGIAYKEGNRSTDREILRLKISLGHDNVEHGLRRGTALRSGLALPRQARTRP